MAKVTETLDPAAGMLRREVSSVRTTDDRWCKVVSVWMEMKPSSIELGNLV